MRIGIVCTLFLAVSLFARQPEHARHAMVVAQEPLAADVGLRVLHSGGNAIDAAVAVSFALSVTYPVAGNIGGGGFLLARFADGRATFIDFREKAPLAATRNMYLDSKGNVTKDSLVGWRAAGVPGTVRGFELAHKKYGHKPWAELVDPAIQLAAGGFPVSYALSASLESDAALLSQFPESKRIFLPAHYGDKLIQPDLAATLKRIRDRGASDFYEGETAQKLAAAMSSNGGLITLADLKDYQALEQEPLRGRYRGDEIITAPPPSSGGVGLLQMLGMLEGSGYEKTGPGSAASIHYVAEVMRRFYADRSEYFGDPDFAKVPVSKLLDPALHREPPRHHRSRPRHAERADSARAVLNVHESTETTHFNIVDAEGNAVAVTYTLNGGYGSGVTVPGLGFLLNNEMDDFAAKPGAENMFRLVQGETNAIQPGKRPAVVHDAHHRAARRKILHGARRARRFAHHQRRARRCF